MAPLVSPFCSPLSSAILQRAEVPAGKQSRPIAPLPYPKWTNRGPPRRAKMNGSLSLSLSTLTRLSLIFAPAYVSSSLLISFQPRPPLARSCHATPRSRASSIPHASLRFALFVSLCPTPLYPLLGVLLFCQCSPVHHVALYPYTVVQPSRSSRTIYFLFLFSPFLPLSLSLCFFLFFSNLCSSPPAHFFRSFSSFPLLLFRALLSSQPEQFFWRLASHAFIRFFYRPNLLRFYTSPVSSRAFTVSPKNTPPTISLVCNFVSIVLIVPVTFSV